VDETASVDEEDIKLAELLPCLMVDVMVARIEAEDSTGGAEVKEVYLGVTNAEK
jgi:hypothetical protein